jgi:hypothetical protein
MFLVETGEAFAKLLSAEVAVVFVDPVLAGRGEDVEVDGVFEGGGGVVEVARDDEYLACFDGVRCAIVVVEAECAFGDEGDLLVRVRVARNDAAFGEHDTSKHGEAAGNELAGEEWIELFRLYFAPAVEGCGRHGKCLSKEVTAADEFLALCCALPCVE